MKKTIIITDTTCDLNQDYIEKEQLVVLKIKAFVGEKNVTDLSDKDLFELVDANQTLPKTSAVNVIEFEETFEKYSKEGDVLYLGLGSGLSSTFSTAYLASQDFDNVYVVKKGDTLYSIAKSFGTTVETIKDANAITSNSIYPYQSIIIPLKFNVGEYLVKKGDTLYQIAKKYGMTVNELKGVNGLTTDTIFAGNVLFISFVPPSLGL